MSSRMQMPRFRARFSPRLWHTAQWREMSEGRTPRAMWVRNGIDIDLHLALWGLECDPQRSWEVLSALTEAISLAGTRIEAFGVVALALSLALHAARPDGSSQPLEDLQRAVARSDIGSRGEVWGSRIDWVGQRRSQSACTRSAPARRYEASEQLLPRGRRRTRISWPRGAWIAQWASSDWPPLPLSRQGCDCWRESWCRTRRSCCCATRWPAGVGQAW